MEEIFLEMQRETRDELLKINEKLEAVAVDRHRISALEARVNVHQKDINELQTVKHKLYGAAAAMTAAFSLALHWAGEKLQHLFN